MHHDFPHAESRGSDPGRLENNVETIRRRMEAAGGRGAHAAASVDLVVVTKSVPAGMFGPLLAAGVREVGENRIQSAAARRRQAPAGLRWHGIGHLQRNKAATALEVFDVFHALDGLRLARRLDALLEGRTAEAATPWPVYLQVNAAEDPDKHGVPPDAALGFLREVLRLPRLAPIGFMTMGKLGMEDGDLRATFRTLREIRDEAVGLGLGNLPAAGLSMGMSDDFELAIEEGATVVRVGRAVFDGVEIDGPDEVEARRAAPNTASRPGQTGECP